MNFRSGGTRVWQGSQSPGQIRGYYKLEGLKVTRSEQGVLECYRITKIEFQTLVESMSRCIETVLARGAQHPIQTFYVGVSFILAVTCMYSMSIVGYYNAVDQNASI